MNNLSNQLALLGGNCNFDDLELNVKVLEKEFDLPFHVIKGHVHNLKFKIPWYKLFSNVVINAETIGNKMLYLHGHIIII